MLRLKRGVIIPLIWQAAMKVDEVLEKEFGLEWTTITAGMDGKHMKGSKHYSGDALDFRTWDWPAGKTGDIVGRIKASLGPRYDVVLEKDHLHVEVR